jgi:FlaG/FlaF family flagellin (archaellin)
MANALYDKGREKFAGGEVAWKAGGDDFYVLLVKVAGGYTVNLSSHNLRNDLGANVLAQSANLGSLTRTSGVCDAADATFTGISSTGTAGAAVICKNLGGDPADDPLIAYLDTITNLPKDLTGITDATLVWSNGTNKIFKL